MNINNRKKAKQSVLLFRTGIILKSLLATGKAMENLPKMRCQSSVVLPACGKLLSEIKNLQIRC